MTGFVIFGKGEAAEDEVFYGFASKWA